MLRASQIAVAAIVAAAVGWTDPVQADNRLADYRHMQGTWTLLYGEYSGAQLSYDAAGQMRLFVRGNRYTIAPESPGLPTGRITLRAGKWPRQIDFTPVTGPLAGQTQQGIYEIIGDTQKVCFAAPGQPRPTRFSTMPGTGQTSYVWLRTRSVLSGPRTWWPASPEFDFVR